MEPATDQVMEVCLGEEDGQVPGVLTDGLVQVQFNINIINNKKDRKNIINNTNNIIYQDKFINIIYQDKFNNIINITNTYIIIYQVNICILGEDGD